MNDLENCPTELAVIDITASTPYNTFYYKKDDCCNGFVKKKTAAALGFKKGFPTNQRGRWNWSTTNTKMYRLNGLIVPNRICSNDKCSNTIKATGARQSGNIFPNTHKMSKQKLFSYLVRNRNYLHR